MKTLCCALAALALAVWCGGARAQQNYPERTLRLLFGFPPGSDTTIRVLADKLSEALGKSVIVENVTGAAGGIAADRTAKAPPDGHTLGVLTGANIVINSSLYAKLPYDPFKDLVPVTLIWEFPNTLVVGRHCRTHEAVAAKSAYLPLADLIRVIATRRGAGCGLYARLSLLFATATRE